MFSERAVGFPCDGDWLYGILHLPEKVGHRGVVVVVGGPQTRVGSHRQFVLLARFLAASGIPVLRFDYRGMGDSSGDPRNFEEIDADIRSAIDAFANEVPAVREVIVWGLCDAAAAAVLYAPNDPRVVGLVLLNPWIRTDQGIARAYLKGYYVSRLFDKELWKKIFRGEFRLLHSLQDLVANIGRAAWRAGSVEQPGEQEGPVAGRLVADSLPDRLYAAWSKYRGRALLILSGADLTAREFLDTTSRSREWRRLLGEPGVTQRRLSEADHTFSSDQWRKQVADWTLHWLNGK